jgi:ketosteroid isomerase-like protein
MYEAGTQSSTDGGMAPFLATYAEDVVVNEPAWLPYGGPNRGHAGIERIMKGVHSLIDVTTIVVEALVVDGDKAVALFRANLHNGAEIFNAEVWTVRDGKVCRGDIFYQDPTPVQGMLRG